MSAGGESSLWLLALPDDVLRLVWSDFLTLDDFVHLDTAICNRHQRRYFEALIPSLRLVFATDTLQVLSQSRNEPFMKQILSSADNPNPRSATFQQFQYVLHRRITIPEIYIKARISKEDLIRWATVFANVRRFKLEPNETERLRSKSLLRFIRTLSPYLCNVDSFELIPYWSLYRYNDDESSDASGAEELDSEFSADFTEDTTSSVDSTMLEDDAHATRTFSNVPKTLLNMLISSFPHMKHIVLQSVDGLEPCHLTQSVMLSIWSQLRKLHLQHVTFFLHSYNTFFASLASHAIYLEDLLITLPRGEFSRAVIAPDVFLTPLLARIPTHNTALRHLRHLSGDFLLMYPIYYYLCGNSSSLKSLDFLFRSKPVEEHLMRLAMRTPQHLYNNSALSLHIQSFCFQAEPRVSSSVRRTLVTDWFRATILTPFLSTLRLFHIHGVTGYSPFNEAGQTREESWGLSSVPEQLISLQCSVTCWLEMSGQAASLVDNSGAPRALQRLCLSPWSQLSSRLGTGGNLFNTNCLVTSLLPFKDSLRELHLIELDGILGQQDPSTWNSLVSIFEAFLLSPAEIEASEAPSWTLSSLKSAQFVFRNNSLLDVRFILNAFLPRAPKLELLDVAHSLFVPPSTLPSSENHAFLLSDDLVTSMVENNAQLRMLALPPAHTKIENTVVELLAKLFAQLRYLQLVSVLHFVDDEGRTDPVPRQFVESMTRVYGDLLSQGGGRNPATGENIPWKKKKMAKTFFSVNIDSAASAPTGNVPFFDPDGNDMDDETTAEIVNKKFMVEVDGVKPSLVLGCK